MIGKNIKTGKVRFSYVHVFEKHGFEDEEKKYSVSILIPKSDKASVKIIKDAIATVIKENKLDAGKLRMPLHDGDKNPGLQGERENMYYFSAKSSRKPQVVDQRGTMLTDDDEFYSGCWGQATLRVYAYTKGGGGIGVGLNNIMKTADDDRFDGATSALSDFQDDFKLDDDFIS